MLLEQHVGCINSFKLAVATNQIDGGSFLHVGEAGCHIAACTSFGDVIAY